MARRAKSSLGRSGHEPNSKLPTRALRSGQIEFELFILEGLAIAKTDSRDRSLIPQCAIAPAYHDIKPRPRPSLRFRLLGSILIR